MSIRRPAGILLVSLATVLAACDDFKSNGVGVGVGLVAPSPFVRASLLPPTLGFTSIAGFRCPTVAPFVSPFSLFIDQRGGTDVFLDHINFQFGDRSGRRSPLQLTRSDLTLMFGTTLMPRGATRRFDFRPQFGCEFLSVPSLLLIDFTTVNRDGVRHQSTLTATLQ